MIVLRQAISPAVRRWHHGTVLSVPLDELPAWCLDHLGGEPGRRAAPVATIWPTSSVRRSFAVEPAAPNALYAECVRTLCLRSCVEARRPMSGFHRTWQRLQRAPAVESVRSSSTTRTGDRTSGLRAPRALRCGDLDCACEDLTESIRVSGVMNGGFVADLGAPVGAAPRREPLSARLPGEVVDRLPRQLQQTSDQPNSAAHQRRLGASVADGRQTA